MSNLEDQIDLHLAAEKDRELMERDKIIINLAGHLEAAIIMAENNQGRPWVLPMAKEDLQKAKDFLRELEERRK